MKGAALARIVCLSACVSCGADIQHVTASDPAVRVIGAHARDARGAVRIAWPATQIALSFRGTGVSAQLEDISVPDATPDFDRVLVLVDDAPVRELALRSGTHRYALADGLSNGVHHVRLWKLTEAEVGTVRVLDFEVRGRVVPSAEQPGARGIVEAIGDSISVGYGDLGAGIACDNVARNTSSYAAYAAVAARARELDYRVMAYSGKGITRNFDPSEKDLLGAIYERALPFEVGATATDTQASADYVVLNVGTNDFFAGVPDERVFRSALTELLARARLRNPRAWIVLALGPMLADDHPAQQARSTLRTWLLAEQTRLITAGDARVAFIEFWGDPAEGLGCDYHPNARAHARLGAELADLIARLGR